MKRSLCAVAAAVVAAWTTPAAAQLALEANAAKSEDAWGLELGAGYTVLSLGGFRVTPAAGAFVFDRSDDRFVVDRTGGSSVCREVATNRTLDDDRCDGTGTRLYARAEATFSIPLSGISAGAGARLSRDDLRPYATATMPLAPFVSLKGNLGPEYFAAGLSARF